MRCKHAGNFFIPELRLAELVVSAVASSTAARSEASAVTCSAVSCTVLYVHLYIFQNSLNPQHIGIFSEAVLPKRPISATVCKCCYHIAITE